ncbi:hypothetical protein MMC14_002706 [Varicellaria rhodocarpa]|nr:hypothetical protein [Varicellaria rhodocarpa]
MDRNSHQLPADFYSFRASYVIRFTPIFSPRRGSLLAGGPQVKTKTMIPAPNNLAILYTCGKINHEAGLLWLRQVLFSFEQSEDLLDKLSPLPSTMLSQIRHIRTGGLFLTLLLNGDDDYTTYSLAWALKLLPALRLDKLTVLGSRYDENSYDTLKDLILYGNG